MQRLIVRPPPAHSRRRRPLPYRLSITRRDDVALQLHVVVRELADLGVVETQDLVLFGGAQLQAGDAVHDEEDEAGADEGVDEGGEGEGELVGELDVVVVEPAAGDDGVAV